MVVAICTVGIRGDGIRCPGRRTAAVGLCTGVSVPVVDSCPCLLWDSSQFHWPWEPPQPLRGLTASSASSSRGCTSQHAVQLRRECPPLANIFPRGISMSSGPKGRGRRCGGPPMPWIGICLRPRGPHRVGAVFVHQQRAGIPMRVPPTIPAIAAIAIVIPASATEWPSQRWLAMARSAPSSDPAVPATMPTMPTSW